MPDILTTELQFGPFYYGTATETNTGLKRKLIWIVDDTGVVVNNPFADPVITRTSTSGTNPPLWSSTMPDLQVGDRIQLDFTSNGSAPDGVAEETHDPVTSDEAINGDITWTTFTGFAGASTVKWRQRYGRTISGVQVWSNWSNVLSDVMGAVAFAPSQLYGGGDIGYAWNTTDGSKIWQNMAGTTPGAFTSGVGRITDISGKGNNLLAQSDSTNRPTWVNTNNGLISFDGSNDELMGIGGFYAAGAMTWIAVIKGTDAGARPLWAECSNSSSAPAYAPCTRANGNATQMLNFQKNDAGSQIAPAVAATLMNGTSQIAFITDDGSTVSISVAGAAFTTAAYTRLTPPTTMNESSFGTADCAGIHVGGFATFNLGSGMIIGRVLTGTLGVAGTEKTLAYNYFATLHGLATL